MDDEYWRTVTATLLGLLVLEGAVVAGGTHPLGSIVGGVSVAVVFVLAVYTAFIRPVPFGPVPEDETETAESRAD